MNMTNSPPTKADELSALQKFAQSLGPHSYLGSWITQAMPYFRDSLQSDILPLTPSELYQRAFADRQQALDVLQEAQLQARSTLDQTREQAHQMVQLAHQEADRIRSRAYQAIRLAMKELES